MDIETLQFYAEHAVELAAKYDTVTGGISQYFAAAFIPGGRVLDIGCGSGRDLRILHKMGYRADAVDATAEFVRYADNCKQEKDCLIVKDSLPALVTVDNDKYDGVLCSAVLMHLPEEQLEDAALAVRRVLKRGGRLLLSVPLHDETINSQTKRDPAGRFFNQVSPEAFQLLFEGIGFKLLKRWDDKDALNRKNRQWATMLFEATVKL